MLRRPSLTNTLSWRAKPTPTSGFSLPIVLFGLWLASLLLAFRVGKQSNLGLRNYGNAGEDGDGGWHNIQVFYGAQKQLDKSVPRHIPLSKGDVRNGQPKAVQKWWSQGNQDLIVAGLFRNKKKGFFIDLAANDARTLSNTFALERNLQWTGLCVEPNPMYWHDLSYRSCQVVAAVVGQTSMQEVQFQFDMGAWGGIVGEEYDVKPGEDVDVAPPQHKYTVTLLEILERFQAPRVIDYLSLDVEGAESFIMHNFPLDKYHIKVMTVERPRDDLVKLLTDKKYKQIKVLTGFGESLWVHQSNMAELDVASLKNTWCEECMEEQAK